MPRYNLAVQIECKPEELKLYKAILDKYALLGSGVKMADDAFNNFDFIKTPVAKKFLIKR